MVSPPPEILVRRSGDGGLIWMIALSALVHALFVASILILPTRFPGKPRVPPSYTVDLVADSVVGGTSLVHGPGGSAKAPLPRQPEEKTQVDSAVNLPKPPPPATVTKRNVVKEEHPAPLPMSKPVEARAPQIKHPEPPAKAAEPPAPKQVTTAKKEAPLPQREGLPKPKGMAPVAEKAARSATSPRHAITRQEKSSEATNSESASGAGLAESKAKQTMKKNAAQHDSSAAIASAVQRRADALIAEAVHRRAEEVAKAGTAGSPEAPGLVTGKPGAGGPIGFGPGSVPGGRSVGEAYIRYYEAMISRIRAAWVWPGAAKDLEAQVQFNILANGDIAEVRIVRASGDSSYDASVERAVRAVSPLDPPPEEYREEFRLVELTFRPDDLRS
jgi:TolA protein